MGTRSRATTATTRSGVFAAIVLTSAVAIASPPHVTFDASAIVACRDVTPLGFADEYPGEKLIEAEFIVTSRLTRGDMKQVQEAYLEVRSPQRRMRIYDYWPNTEYESDVEGTIEVTETTENSNSSGIGLAGSLTTPETPVKAIISPSANLGKTKRELKTKKYQRVASKRAVLISGTTHQGHGMFVKRLPSEQSSLEGSETITCHFIVSDDWQGDWIEIYCRAKGTRKKSFSESTGTVGAANISVGLFMAGNREARDAAALLAKSQAQANRWKHEMRKKSDFSKAADRLAMSLDSLACNMKLGRCDKHQRNRRQANPQQTFIKNRNTLAKLAGEPTPAD